MRRTLRQQIALIQSGQLHIDSIPAGRRIAWDAAETAIIDQVSTESEGWPRMTSAQQDEKFLRRLLELLPQ